uniref:Putative antimicrobial peptide 5 n=1 Tax=Tityus costatus TaxID=309814 RepID=NDB4T_TITCO|nr:RecName: Full=Putative antimicrobial peptide clone 5; Flags: Precursor [Tityus costatus]AAW72457.1 putative antimicrobial peptide precursor [Tityus costatus]
MQIKHLITLFFLVLIGADQCSAFFSLIPSLIGGLVFAIKGRKKREVSPQIDQYRNFQKREAELEELLDRLPMY